MLVRITRVLEVRPDGVIVEFCSPVGSASAKWMGRPPQEDQEYVVEIGIPGVLTWGSNISPTKSEPGVLRQEGGSVHIIAEILRIGDDHVAQVSLGADTLLVETSDLDHARISVPCNAVITTPFLELFDTNL